MASNAAKECNICNEEYNEGDRCPRSLPCSHCLCTMCIQNLITRNKKKCPFCLRDFQANSAKDIGINTSLLDVLKYLKEMEQRFSAPRSDNTTVDLVELKKQTKELAKEFIVRYQTSEEDIDHVIKDHSDLQDNLLTDLQCVQNEVMAKMKEFTTRTLKKVNYIESQKKKLTNQRKSTQNKRRELADAITKLENSVSFKEAGPVIDEVKDVTSDSRKSLQQIDEFLKEAAEKSCGIRKVTESSKVKLQKVLSILESSSEEEEQLDLCVDMKLLEIQHYTSQPITIESFGKRSGSVMELMNQKRLFAVQDFEGRKRFAQISLEENNRILLHCLKDQKIPSNAHLLQHNEVLKLVKVSSRLSYMELHSKEKNKTLGKLFIRLSPDGKRAQQFSLLCSGQNGPFYVDTNIINVRNKGNMSEFVLCGDYENLGGKGGRALVSHVLEEEGGVFMRPCLAGTIQGWGSYASEAAAAQFYIHTRDNPRKQLNGCFGMVEEGLPILQDAINNHQDICNVTISDAGLVIDI